MVGRKKCYSLIQHKIVPTFEIDSSTCWKRPSSYTTRYKLQIHVGSLCTTGLNNRSSLNFVYSSKLHFLFAAFTLYQAWNGKCSVSQGELNEVQCNLGKVNHEPMCPVVSLICGMATRACLAMCKPLTGLPWNLPAMPGIYAGPPPTFDGTSSQAHQLAMSLWTV